MIKNVGYILITLGLFTGCTVNYKTFGLDEYDDAEEYVARMMVVGNKVSKTSPSKEFFYNESEHQFDTLYVVKYRNNN